jgi:hypothetical protein
VVVSHNQYADALTDHAKKEMIRKSFEVHPPEIALADAESFPRIGCLLKEGAQLGIELIGKLLPGDIFVLLHECARYLTRSAGVTPDALATPVVNVGIQLRQRNSLLGIGVHFRVAAQSFRNAFILVPQNTGKRFEEIRCEDRSFPFWQVERELLYFNDGGHA